MEKTKTINVTMYPYAVQYGTIKVPNEISESNDESKIKEYITEHFTEIEFEDAELDYGGTDFDYTIE